MILFSKLYSYIFSNRKKEKFFHKNVLMMHFVLNDIKRLRTENAHAGVGQSEIGFAFDRITFKQEKGEW